MTSKINQTLEKCFHCGLCKANCPVYNTLLNETVGPRGKAILLKKGILDKVFYSCSLCKSCESECPAKVELADEIKNAREKLVDKGMETDSNKKMIQNIRKFGNPFGEIKEGKMPKELYCC
jgi:Fe-S oxidoreductase